MIKKENKRQIYNNEDFFISNLYLSYTNCVDLLREWGLYKVAYIYCNLKC